MTRTPLRFAAALSTLLYLTPTASEAQSPISETAACGPKTCRTESGRTDSGLELFAQALKRIRETYVDPVDEQRLIEAAIEGMAESLDSHSRYLGAESLEEARLRLRGEFGGLGIRIAEENGQIKVVSPSEGAPAARAGILAGDIITHLDGHPLADVRLSDAIAQIRGPLGTQIAMTIRRDGFPEPFEFTLTREAIKLHPVRHHTQGRIGYIQISKFDQQTQPGLEDAIKAIKTELGDSLLGYVVDLRDNPGGLLNQAVLVSDSFLDHGLIVSTRGRRPGSTRHFDAKPGDLAGGLPMIVLINSGSASASEIVAGALQDHHRAMLLGTQSYGKGTVQSTMSLRNDGALRITTARYYTPSGRSIHGRGITPDVEVAEAKEGDEDGVSKTAATDRQLARAVDLLCGIATFRAMEADRMHPAEPMQEFKAQLKSAAMEPLAFPSGESGSEGSLCGTPDRFDTVSFQPEL